AGCEKKLTPAQAREQKIPMRTLTPEEVRSLEAFGEILLPGSAAAGLAQFIDYQLSGAPDDSMLMIKYLGVSPPFSGFYRAGLRGLDAVGQSQHGGSFASLDSVTATSVVTALATGRIVGWQGPPAGLFYFVVRNDAIDVTYGTQHGFELLGVPYMPH